MSICPVSLWLILFCWGTPGWAQGTISPSVGIDPHSEPLVTDRPDFTESALTVPSGLRQAEFGSTTTRLGTETNNGFGEMLLRIGLDRHTELRLGLPSYQTTRGSASGNSSGFADASIGFKFSLQRAGDRLGARDFDIGLIVASTLPTGSAAFGNAKAQPGVKLLIGSALTKTIAVSANLNYDYVNDSEEQYGEVASSLSFGFEITDRTGIYAEYFGFYPLSTARNDTNYVNTGVTYLIHNDLQLDARVGNGWNGVRSDYFIGAGASVRF